MSMTPDDTRAELRAPSVQATRRTIGIATPAMIAAGDPLHEEEAAAVRRSVEAIAAWAGMLRPTVEEAARGIVAWFESIPPDVRAQIAAAVEGSAAPPPEGA